MISLERNRPHNHGKVFVPLRDLPETARAAILRRRSWIDNVREVRRRQLYESAINARPGALYRYLHFAWTHMHPYFEWPVWYAEQLEAIRWGYRQIERVPIWERNPLYAQTGPKGKYLVLDREAELELKHRGLLGQIIIMSGGQGASPPSGGVVAGAFHLGGSGANDSNNGILVADGGTGPWLTWSKLNSELAAGSLGIGDTAYMRGGTYVPTALTRWEGGGSVANAQKITLSGYPGETANIDFSVNDDRTMLDGGTGTGPIILSCANYRLQDFTFTNYAHAFATDNGVAVHGTEFLRLTRVRFGSGISSGNAGGCIVLDDGSSNNQWLIEGCDLSDGNEITGGNGNTVYVIHAQGTARNNLIGALGTTGYAFHVKRMNNSSVLGNITIENNVIGRYGSGTGSIYWNNTQYGLVQHNCFSAPSGGVAMYGSDTGEPSNWPWYRNQLLHNTCRHSSGSTGYGLATIDNNNTAGNSGTENTVEDNAQTGGFGLMPNQNTKTHNNVFDYNLYDAMPTNLAREFSTNYAALTNWRGATTYMSAPDLNSDEETIPWDTTLDQFDPLTYRLGAGSAGIGSAQDMTDRGADVDLVGPAALG